MSILCKNEISKLMKEDKILIYPFEEKNLKGIGFNFTVGPLAWSAHTKKPLKVIQKHTEKYYVIESNDVGLVMTRETIAINDELAGTFHSKVDKVSLGFSHISTTLDPNWVGPLLVSIANNTNKKLELKIYSSFLTLILYNIKKTSISSVNPPGRSDVINSLRLVCSSYDNQWLQQEFRNNFNSLLTKIKEGSHDEDSDLILNLKLKKKLGIGQLQKNILIMTLSICTIVASIIIAILLFNKNQTLAVIIAGGGIGISQIINTIKNNFL